MERDYRYFLDESKKLCRFHVDVEEDASDPRKDYDNLGTMMVWWNRYDLGDENKFNSPSDFLDDLVHFTLTNKQIINYVKKGKASNGLQLKYNRSKREWELWGTYYLWPLENAKEAQFSVIASDPDIYWLVDEIIESLPIQDKLTLLEKEFFFLPIYIYEHSGLCMNTGGFACPWDSGQAGWIYVSKEKVMEEGIQVRKNDRWVKANSKNWKEAAERILEGEVKLYDQYLQGECYGWIIEEWNGDDWDYKDSCWGYFSDKWGNELIEELKCEALGRDVKLYGKEDVA